MKLLIVFLHGSGGTGPELNQFLTEFPIPSLDNKSFIHFINQHKLEYDDIQYSLITPTADMKNYSPAFNEPMSVWYDRSVNFVELGRNDKEDINGIESSLQKISNIIRTNEAQYDHIFIGGFSMGGGLALHFLRDSIAKTACCYPTSKIAGIFTIGSFLSNHSIILKELRSKSCNSHDNDNQELYSNDTRKLPVFMMHGAHDSLIDMTWGESTASDLLTTHSSSSSSLSSSSSMIDIHFQSFPGVDHEIGDLQLVELVEWMKHIVILKQKQLMEKETNVSTEQMIDHMKATSLTSSEQQQVASQIIMSSTRSELVPLPVYHPFTIVPEATVQQQQQRQQADNSNNNSNNNSTNNTNSNNNANNLYRIYFEIPKSMVDVVISRPMLVCGGQFDLQLLTSSSSSSAVSSVTPSSSSSSSPSESTTVMVYTIAQTTNPDNVGIEMGKRLKTRLSSTEQINPCPIS